MKFIPFNWQQQGAGRNLPLLQPPQPNTRPTHLRSQRAERWGRKGWGRDTVYTCRTGGLPGPRAIICVLVPRRGLATCELTLAKWPVGAHSEMVVERSVQVKILKTIHLGTHQTEAGLCCHGAVRVQRPDLSLTGRGSSQVTLSGPSFICVRKVVGHSVQSIHGIPWLWRGRGLGKECAFSGCSLSSQCVWRR